MEKKNLVITEYRFWAARAHPSLIFYKAVFLQLEQLFVHLYVLRRCNYCYFLFNCYDCYYYYCFFLLQDY